MISPTKFPLQNIRRLCCLLLLALSVSAARDRNTGQTSPGTNAAASPLHEIVAAGKLSDLRWPDFSDYRPQVRAFYESSNYSPAWVRDNQPTPQAREMIETLQHADSKGLKAEDYDSSRWSARLGQLNDPAAAARFDIALTVCAMRFVAALDVGRVNPSHLKFALTTKNARFDLPQFLRDRIANGDDVKASLSEIEPQYPGYKRTLISLQHYQELSGQDDSEQLSVPVKPIDSGSEYGGVPRLTRLLRLLGDLPPDSNAVLPTGNIYQPPLVDAVKRFQQRHGLSPDGRLGAQTIKQLNTPLSGRVEQLRLTLEHWRWIPHEFPQPPVVVNIPEFRLRAFDPAGKVVLSMNVIVGKAYRHETPVFDEDMKFVVFRPYWNVPRSILRSEIVPAIQKDRGYIAKKNYEVVTAAGQVVTSGEISDDILQQLQTGKLSVRQKPGPTNALGLVKLMFPNEYSVYLHSTPSQQLFSQIRRDFSHGCIRVEKPAELSAWALQGNPDWTLERVRATMQGDKDSVQVNLTKPIPVLILYGTAVVDEDGAAHFFDDIYGHDATLEKMLAKGYPYPQ